MFNRQGKSIMKKYVLQIVVFAFIILLGSCKEKQNLDTETLPAAEIQQTENFQDENIQITDYEDTVSQEPDIVENQEDEDLSILNSDKNYQTEDPLKSNYRKTYWDGMSWRKRDITYDENNKTIDKEKMMSTIWNLDSSIAYDYILLFYLDDVFQIGDIHSASIFAQGNYRFEDGKLVLYSIVYNKTISFIASIFEGMEIIVPDLRFESNHFYYDNELIINGTTFYPQGCIKKDGERAVIDGVHVITERTKKVFTDNVRFRTAPSTSAKTQIVDLYDISTGEKTDVLRKGTVLNTYARTESAEIIDGIESPWYYIRVDGQYGWVFGAYFTDYEE